MRNRALITLLLLLLIIHSLDGHQSMDQETKNWASQMSQNQINKQYIEWVKEQLKKEIPAIQDVSKKITSKECETCTFVAKEDSAEPKLLIFMSFSVPIESWLSLSAEMKAQNGVFLIRGLPDNSFQELAKRIMLLKERGFDGTIQIDPMAFRTYEVTCVPTFIKREGESYNKIQGNISLFSALNLFKERGEASG